MTTTPEFKWVARNLTLDEVRNMVQELLHFDQPSGSFKIIENGTQGKRIIDAVVIKRERYDMYFDDFSCGYLQAAWKGWDPSPNCSHVTLGSAWYPHCAEMTCWNYVNRGQTKPTADAAPVQQLPQVQVGLQVKNYDGTWGVLKEIRPNGQIVVRVDGLDEFWSHDTIEKTGNVVPY